MCQPGVFLSTEVSPYSLDVCERSIVNAAELIEGYTAYATPEELSVSEVTEPGHTTQITTMDMPHTTQITTFVAA